MTHAAGSIAIAPRPPNHFGSTLVCAFMCCPSWCAQNTVDLGGTLASWGQGDRVGLMLDTHTSELSFIKNGVMFEQKYAVAIDAGMYFAVGRYYGSYVVRCLYIHQLGGNETMDYGALDRLCAYIESPANQLQELSISNSQLAGVSKFSSGRRNDQGLVRLLEAFGHDNCKLSLLDISNNDLSDPDAAAVLSVSLRSHSR
eukprot:2725366-Pleurochrysis_carterae.AAC.1